MLDEQTRQRIIKEETAAFLDQNFGGLDLSGSPDLANPANEEAPAADGDRHGFNKVAVAGANGLKQFASSPDLETLERIADETGDADLQTRIAESQATDIAKQFVNRTPQYLQSEQNFEAIVSYMLQKYLQQSLRVYDDADSASIALLNAGAWTVENITSAFKTLLRAGRLEVEAGVAKALSESEKLHVISLCKSGQLEDAVSQYLSYAYPNAESDWSDVTAFLSDPATLQSRNDACRFVWYHSRPGVQDSAEWRAFEAKWFRHRPLRAVSDYDFAYAEFEKEYKNELRNKLLSPDEPATVGAPARSQQRLDDLDDEAFDRLYHGTLREYARNAKRQPGVLV